MGGDGWLQVVQEFVKLPGLLKEIYGDLAKPGVKQVGKALETVVGLGNTLMWPIALLNERSRLALENNLERYRQKLERVPEEKIVNVMPEIGVPIAERLTYVTDPNLSELYISLLAGASNADELDRAHPSFVNVIANLSPDEAILLRRFTSSARQPLVFVKMVNNKDQSYVVLQGAFMQKFVTSELTFPANIAAYLSNLAGLGLLEVVEGKELVNGNYEAIEGEQRDGFTKLIAAIHPDGSQRLQFERGVVEATSFGRQFISACHVLPATD